MVRFYVLHTWMFFEGYASKPRQCHDMLFVCHRLMFQDTWTNKVSTTQNLWIGLQWCWTSANHVDKNPKNHEDVFINTEKMKYDELENLFDKSIILLDLPDSLTYYWWFVSWFGNRLHPEWVQIVYNKERWCWHSPLRVDSSAMACLPCISLHKQNIPMPSYSRLLVPIPIMNSRKIINWCQFISLI